MALARVLAGCAAMLALCLASGARDAAADVPQPVVSLSALLGVDDELALSPAQILDPARALGDGLSLGTTSSGRLLRGVELPTDGERLAVLATHHERRAHFASRNLAQLLGAVADAVVAEGAPRLLLGDASAADGGDLRGHGSHNSGRDVDVVFFVRDAHSGEPVEPSRMVAFRDVDGDLSAEPLSRDGRYRFDLERNWAFVEALMGQDEVEVQYIFIYDPLRQRLLAHAAAAGVDAERLARAERLLRQPGDSSPHDDHFHVRVFCSARDRLEGCDNRGPLWSWAQLHDDAVAVRAQALLRAAELEPQHAPDALSRLATMHARQASPALARLAADADAEVRAAAREALWQTGVAPEAFALLGAAALREPDPLARRSLYGLIGASAHVDAIAFLASAAASETDAASALRAARAMAAIEHHDAVPALIGLLDHDEVPVREVARDALRALTNHGGPQDAHQTDVLVAWWQDWWREHHAHSRDAWWLAGFRDAGLELVALDQPQCVPALIEAHTDQPEWLALNAHRAMMQATDHWFSPSTPTHERRTRWQTWWTRNRWRYEASDASTRAAQQP